VPRNGHSRSFPFGYVRGQGDNSKGGGKTDRTPAAKDDKDKDKTRVSVRVIAMQAAGEEGDGT